MTNRAESTPALISTEWAVRSDETGRIITRTSEDHAEDWLIAHAGWEVLTRVVVIGDWQPSGTST